MSVQKKVSFGSKNSMVETWIIDDAADNRKKCGDVREIGGGFYDDAMTSSTDVMVVSSKSTNHKIPNRHVTIGDSTILIMTPESTPDTPDADGARVLGGNARSYSPLSSPAHTGAHSGNSMPQGAANARRLPARGPGSPRSHGHPAKEEYYDVIHPEPKDQTREYEDEDDDAPGDYEPEDVYPLGSPDDLLDDPHARYVVDSLTGWPLKRSQSLESRDNPFLPGGDLSREAEDLLRRATIIRDNFYLNEEEKKTLQEQQLLQQKQGKQPRSTKHVQIVDQDGHPYGGDSSPTSSGAVEERISPQSSNTFAAAPAPHNGGGDGAQPKENGKAGELTAASPDSGKTAIPDSDGQSLPLGQTGPGSGGLSGGGELQVHDSDKKKRNKCCSVM